MEPRRREAPRRAVAAAAGAEPFVSLLDWLDADGGELIERYDRLYVPRNDPRWLRRNALVAAGNVGGRAEREAVAAYAAGDDELLRDHAEWALARIDDSGTGMTFLRILAVARSGARARSSLAKVLLDRDDFPAGYEAAAWWTVAVARAVRPRRSSCSCTAGPSARGRSPR